MPAPEAPAPLSAPRNPWVAFVADLTGILFRPTHTWTRLTHHQTTVAQVMWPYILVLALVRAAAELVGALASSRGFAEALKLGIFSVVAWVSLAWVLASITATVSAARGAQPGLANTLRFVALSLSPLFVGGVLSAVPVPYATPVVDAIAMPYAFYILSVGVVPSLGVPSDRAPGAVGLLTGALFLGWALIPNLLRLGIVALGTR